MSKQCLNIALTDCQELGMNGITKNRTRNKNDQSESNKSHKINVFDTKITLCLAYTSDYQAGDACSHWSSPGGGE